LLTPTLDTEEGWVEEMRKYAVVFEKAAHNWGAYVPDLPECVTTGATLEETRRLIAEAIEFHIEGMRLRGERVPKPTSLAESVEVPAA
jgi:predicted RNase H-like HicB family nuclease